MNKEEKQERRFQIYEKILMLKTKNDLAFDAYKKAIENLAETNSNQVFFQRGDSKEEEMIDELEKELKNPSIKIMIAIIIAIILFY